MDLNQEWLGSFKAGSKGTFEELVKETQKMVYSIVFSYVRDREATNDLSQETYLRAFESVKLLKDPLKIKSWVCGIARNTALEWVKKRKNAPRQLQISDNFEQKQHEVFSYQNSLCKAFQELRPDEREIIALRYQQDLSYSQIAEALSMTITGVGEKLSRLRKRIGDKVRMLNIDIDEAE